MSGRCMKLFEEQGAKPHLTMAPLIDMVFLLIIFFIVTTTFTREAGIAVERSVAESAETLSDNLMIVYIDQSGRYWHGQKQRSLTEVVRAMRQRLRQNRATNFVLVPDRRSSVDPLIRILDELLKYKIYRFCIGTESDDTSRMKEALPQRHINQKRITVGVQNFEPLHYTRTKQELNRHTKHKRVHSSG